MPFSSAPAATITPETTSRQWRLPPFVAHCGWHWLLILIALAACLLMQSCASGGQPQPVLIRPHYPLEIRQPCPETLPPVATPATKQAQSLAYLEAAQAYHKCRNQFQRLIDATGRAGNE